MTLDTDSTKGETRDALALLAHLDPAMIHHYAIVMATEDGTLLKFCCDDRRDTRRLLNRAARLLVSAPGESMNSVPPPPMPADGPVTDDHREQVRRAREEFDLAVADGRAAILGALAISTSIPPDVIAAIFDEPDQVPVGS